MARAPKYCAHGDCMNLIPGGTRNCPEHTSRWGNTTRRRPKGWANTRARILKRDKNACYICHGPATEVDHIDNLGGETDDNLAAICNACHTRKTLREARESRLTAR